MQIRTLFRPRNVFIAIIVTVIAWFIHTLFFAPAAAPNYITTKVAKRNLEQTVLADGTIKALKQVNVGAQVSGQIKALHVALGDKVTKDQPVADIDDLTQQNNLRNAEAALKSTTAQRTAKQATLRNNQLAFERQRTILAKGVGVKADYDSAKAALDSTKAEIEALDAQIVQAQINVDTAKLNLGYTKIISPIDGVVVAIPVEEGQTVNAVQSAPTIIKVAQLDTMTIVAQISEADVPKVKEGLEVYFTILGEPNKRYSATLRAIEPAPDSINTDTTTTTSTSSTSTAIYYNGLLDVKNPDGKLRISMTAQVYIVLKQAKEALVIPSTALNNIDNQGNATVGVIDKAGSIQEQKVTVGINNNVDAQITSGLNEGDTIVVGESGGATSGSANRQRRMGPMGM